MSLIKKFLNFFFILILIIYFENSNEIILENFINEFTGIYISINSDNNNSNKIFDLNSLNITDQDYNIYINGTRENLSSTIYPFKKGITYNIKGKDK